MSYVNTTCPNATLFVAYMGYGTKTQSIYERANAYLYADACGKCGATYLGNISFALRNDISKTMASDGVHPTNYGQQEIASLIANSLKGHDDFTTLLFSVQDSVGDYVTSFDNGVLTLCMLGSTTINTDYTGELGGTNIVHTITLDIKCGSINNSEKAVTFTTPGVANVNGKFYPCDITFISSNAQNEFNLYVRCLNDDNTNYRSGTLNSLQFSGFTYKSLPNAF